MVLNHCPTGSQHNQGLIGDTLEYSGENILIFT